MPKLRSELLGLPLFAILAAVLSFDRLLLAPGSRLPGAPEQTALSLLGVWWPGFSLGQPDGLAIHSFIAAPYLSNHLANMPLVQGALFALLRPLLGVALAFNLLLLASLLATYFATAAFLRSKRVPALLAALGALALAFSPWAASALARASLIDLALWTLPLALLAWDRWLADPRPWRAVFVVLTLYLAVLCGAQFVPLLLLFWLPYAVWTGKRLWAAGADGQRSLQGKLSVMALALFVLMLVYPLPVLARTLQGTEPAYSAALAAPVPRTHLRWVFQTSPAIFLLGLLTLVAAGRRAGREVVFWLAVAGAGLLIGFGLLPDPLQFLLAGLGFPATPLADRAFFFGPALLALVTAGGLAWGSAWKPAAQTLRWGSLSAALALILVTNPATFRAIPTHPLDPPAFYASIAAEPEDYILLEYPFGLACPPDGVAIGGAPSGAYLARYALWHHKRTAGGVLPHCDSRLVAAVGETAYLFPEGLPEPERDSAAAALAGAVRAARIGYAVIHRDLLTAEAHEAAADLLNRSGALCPPVKHGDLSVYRARWHPAGCDAP